MQMSFVGVGAVLAGKLPHGMPFPLMLLIVGVVTGLIGAVVALPAVRLRGIYLALLTLAVAILFDTVVFDNRNVLGGGTTLKVDRPSFLGMHFTSERSFFVLLAIVAVVMAHVFLAARKSRFGRLLNGMRDAPNACQTLGMNVTMAKLQVFFLSAMLAGIAGVFLGELQGRVGETDFLYFRSLTVLLVATIFGIASVTGAFFGALFFVVLPELTRHADASGGQAVQPLIIGLLAIATASRPEGVAGRIRGWVRPFVHRVAAFRPVPSRPARTFDVREAAVAREVEVEVEVEVREEVPVGADH
jgi:branched-chain amino acid transport system permease protein